MASIECRPSLYCVSILTEWFTAFFPVSAVVLAKGKQHGSGGLTDAGDDEMARWREAFIASERARNAGQSAVRNEPPQQAAPRRTERQQAPARYADTPVMQTTYMRSRPEKSLLLAYAFWFFAATISAHRLYLGAWRSAFT